MGEDLWVLCVLLKVLSFSLDLWITGRLFLKSKSDVT